MIYEGEFLNADFNPAHSDSDFSHHFHHRVCVRRHHGFVLRRHEEYGAPVVGIAFAIYPLVPKLPQEPEVKPDKYTLFG